MIQLSDEQIRKLQLHELDLLLELDRICRKHKICYSLTGGTLLGAVRHGGFIPWDDDADVSMMRGEYEKFVRVCERELDPERFYLQHMENTPGYRWGYAKLRKKNTLFLREHQEHMPYEQGIFLDIFPRDGVPDGAISRKIHKARCFCIRKILWSAVGRFAAKQWYMRAWYAGVNRLFGDRICRIYRRLVASSNRSKTRLVRALTFPVPGGHDGYRRDWYDRYEDIMFENHAFMVEAGYRDWLSQEFGDYMKLPPEEKRKVHPVVDIKL